MTADALAAFREQQLDAQFAASEADLLFYQRGFPLGDFTDVPDATESPVERTDA